VYLREVCWNLLALISVELALFDLAVGSIGWSMTLLLSVCRPSTLRTLICPEASSAQNGMAAVSAEGRTAVLIRLNSSCNRSVALVVPALRHLPGGRRAKAKGLSCLLELSEPPLAQESLAARGDLLGRRSDQHLQAAGAHPR